MPEGNRPFQPFPTTKWSLIARVSAEDPADRERALGEVCALYRTPVFDYIRHLGHNPQDAEDLTQEFFGTLLKRNTFSRADAERGSLRQYLRSAVKYFLAGQHRKSRSRRRGGDVVKVPLDSGFAANSRAVTPASEELSPDRFFDRQWATTVLENVLQKLEDHYRSKGQEEVFKQLGPYVRADASPPAQAELARELGIAENTLRVSIHRFRQRYKKLLLEEIAATVGPGGDVAEELRYLRSIFG